MRAALMSIERSFVTSEGMTLAAQNVGHGLAAWSRR
jgi:hypothetical protein